MAGYLPGVRQGAVGGMSQLAAALGQGGQLEQRAFDAENLNQSRIAQALATIRHLDAQTGETGAKTDFLRNRPALYQQQAALASDTDVPTIQAFLQKLTTGKAPQVPMGPEAPDGSMGVGSQQFDPAVSSRIALALQRNAPLIADGGHIGAGDWAGALDKFREHDLSNEVLRGVRTPSDVGQAQAAMAGKPLFAGDNSGGMVDVFRGTRDTSSPEAAAALKEREARATQLRAAAESSSASAQEHRARAAQINAEGGGVTKLQPGFRWTDSTKTKQEFIPGGPADPQTKAEGKPLKDIPPAVNTAIISNSQNISRAQQALQLLSGADVGGLKGDKTATGLKGMLPQALLNRVDPAGVDTRAMIADLGSMVIHDRSGAAVTAAESPRLMPFIPLNTDDAVTVKKKITRFLQVYQQEQQALMDTYSSDQGYKPSPLHKGGQAAPSTGSGGFRYLGKEP